MTDDLSELRRRLVVGRKSDGRSVYDEGAKAELVTLCRQPGASVSRLARECGVNANQVSRWLREHEREARARHSVANVAPTTAAFVPVALPPVSMTPTVMDMQARLPNGVVIDMRGLDLRNVGEMIQVFGSLRCSVLTKA